jgi:TRAP-type mannitol/chloroaromatic compound transport system permease small subunit
LEVKVHLDSSPVVQGPANNIRKIVDTIDNISGFFGKAVSILLIPMVYCLLHEVVGRYFFTAPTIWAGDLAMIMYGMLFMIASPYCLREGGHIRTDFLYNRWSERTQGMVDLLIYLIVFLPVHLVFLKVSWDFFLKSYQLGERIISSPWMPIIWPLKFAIPLGIFLITLQGIAETIKSFYAWKYGKFFWARHAHGAEEIQEDLTSCSLK